MSSKSKMDMSPTFYILGYNPEEDKMILEPEDKSIFIEPEVTKFVFDGITLTREKNTSNIDNLDSVPAKEGKQMPENHEENNNIQSVSNEKNMLAKKEMFGEVVFVDKVPKAMMCSKETVVKLDEVTKDLDRNMNKGASDVDKISKELEMILEKDDTTNSTANSEVDKIENIMNNDGAIKCLKENTKNKNNTFTHNQCVTRHPQYKEMKINDHSPETETTVKKAKVSDPTFVPSWDEMSNDKIFKPGNYLDISSCQEESDSDSDSYVSVEDFNDEIIKVQKELKPDENKSAKRKREEMDNKINESTIDSVLDLSLKNKKIKSDVIPPKNVSKNIYNLRLNIPKTIHNETSLMGKIPPNNSLAGQDLKENQKTPEATISPQNHQNVIGVPKGVILPINVPASRSVLKSLNQNVVVVPQAVLGHLSGLYNIAALSIVPTVVVPAKPFPSIAPSAGGQPYFNGTILNNAGFSQTKRFPSIAPSAGASTISSPYYNAPKTLGLSSRGIRQILPKTLEISGKKTDTPKKTTEQTYLYNLLVNNQLQYSARKPQPASTITCTQSQSEIQAEEILDLTFLNPSQELDSNSFYEANTILVQRSKSNLPEMPYPDDTEEKEVNVVEGFGSVITQKPNATEEVETYIIEAFETSLTPELKSTQGTEGAEFSVIENNKPNDTEIVIEQVEVDPNVTQNVTPATQYMQCKFCPFRAATVGALQFHTRNIHSDMMGNEYFMGKYYPYVDIHSQVQLVNTFRCKLCPFSTTNRHGLKLHLTKKHDKLAPRYQCRNCIFSTKNKKSLLGHQKIHARDCPQMELQCQECGHKLPHDVEKYYCDMCPFETIYQTSMRHHKRRHLEKTDEAILLD